MKFLVDYKVHQRPIFAKCSKKSVPLEQDVLLKLLLAVSYLNVVLLELLNIFISSLVDQLVQLLLKVFIDLYLLVAPILIIFICSLTDAATTENGAYKLHIRK